MRILIYGAGAIGSDLGAMLTASGEDVTLLARGAQLAALKSQGVIVERKDHPTRQVPVRAAPADQCQGPYDLILVTLKSMQLEAVAQDIVSRLAPDGAMVMIQNGLPWWYFDGIDSPFAGGRLPCLDPRGVLREFGTELPVETEVRVWDSTSEVRFMVLPERPAGTEGMSEEELAALVTRDSMIGVTKLDARR